MSWPEEQGWDPKVDGTPLLLAAQCQSWLFAGFINAIAQWCKPAHSIDNLIAVDDNSILNTSGLVRLFDGFQPTEQESEDIEQMLDVSDFWLRRWVQKCVNNTTTWDEEIFNAF